MRYVNADILTELWLGSLQCAYPLFKTCLCLLIATVSPTPPHIEYPCRVFDMNILHIYNNKSDTSNCKHPNDDQKAASLTDKTQSLERKVGIIVAVL